MWIKNKENCFCWTCCMAWWGRVCCGGREEKLLIPYPRRGLDRPAIGMMRASVAWPIFRGPVLCLPRLAITRIPTAMIVVELVLRSCELCVSHALEGSNTDWNCLILDPHKESDCTHMLYSVASSPCRLFCWGICTLLCRGEETLLLNLSSNGHITSFSGRSLPVQHVSVSVHHPCDSITILSHALV